MNDTEVILLPGAVLPAKPAFAALIDALGTGVSAHTKDLEVYATERPAPGYALDDEAAGLLRAADEAGFATFHAVGYSAGGASLLRAVTQAPRRFRSLALLEPAWAGWTGIDEAEAAMWARIRDIMRLPEDRMMRAFVEAELAPGVTAPQAPQGPPPAWMAKRPPGLRALTSAFDATDLDPAQLRSYDRPVYFALGGLSYPDHYARIADRLGRLFPDFTLERFEERHHFDPPHRVEPERLAASLRALWARADSGAR